MEKVFELNKYVIYVANKIVNGKKITLVWYVDDDKVSHTVAKVVEDLIKYLKEQSRELVVTRGKKHTFLGMNINITEDKKVDIDMK